MSQRPYKRILLTEDVRDIITRLEAAGHEAYIVGGCVRDSLLGRQPADWDITTSASPQEVKRIFRHTVDTGLQHGTVTVLYRGHRTADGHQPRPVGYEVTTYRVDGDYADGRHPSEVRFTRDLREDLRRRDFTVNAMAYHPERGLVDLFGGRKDLAGHTIRAVGDARERFTEDALRMMRAVRFAAQLGSEIEPSTWAAIRELRGNLVHVSAERIRVEMEKLLVSDHPGYFRYLYESGLTAQFLPEWDEMMETTQETPHHCYTVGEHSLHALDAMQRDALQRIAEGGGAQIPEDIAGCTGETQIPEDIAGCSCGAQMQEGTAERPGGAQVRLLTEDELRIARLTMLLHDVAKPTCKTMDADGVCHFHGHPERGAEMAEEILRRLKYDKRTIDLVTGLIRVHDARWKPTETRMRRAVRTTGERYFPLIFAVTRADVLAQSDYQREEKLQLIQGQYRVWREVTARGDCVSMQALAVKGRDLIEAGIAPGPALGEILERMLDNVLDQPAHNVRSYLMEHYVPGRESDASAE